jgi:RNA polymerase sigma factor (TIGR02999 family)
MFIHSAVGARAALLDSKAREALMDALFDEVYDRLRAVARQQRRGVDGGATLDTTALVHEVYLQFCDERASTLAPRDFFAYAARAMRNLLIDRARRHASVKRGGDAWHTGLDGSGSDAASIIADHAIEIDDALRRLAIAQPRAAQVVELHYFAGIDFEKIAELLDLNRRTVHRDWTFARAWLYQHLR